MFVEAQSTKMGERRTELFEAYAGWKWVTERCPNLGEWEHKTTSITCGLSARNCGRCGTRNDTIQCVSQPRRRRLDINCGTLCNVLRQCKIFAFLDKKIMVGDDAPQQMKYVMASARVGMFVFRRSLRRISRQFWIL